MPEKKYHPTGWPEADIAFVQSLDAQARLSNRTRLEMETGALSNSMEDWLRYISSTVMMQMMHELVFHQRV